MNSFKINIIVNWFILINIKDVQSFLDFANFYRRFIYDYSRIAISLIHLIRKDVFFVWFQKCQIAFNILKKVFTFKIILRHYNSDHKIVIEINVSNYVFKDILFQYDENEILHSCSWCLQYQSHKASVTNHHFRFSSVTFVFNYLSTLANFNFHESRNWRIQCWKHQVSARSRHFESWWRFCWHSHSDIVKVSWNQW